jgi:GTP cyclohydrolase II
LGVEKLQLITNNPLKIAQLEENGFVVQKRVPMTPPSNAHNERYLQTKQERSGHMISK